MAQTLIKAAQPFELRRARPADRDALAAMYRRFKPKAAAFSLPPRGNPERWLDSLSRSANFIVVADGRVAGHAILCPDGYSAEVAVFVHQDFRRRGLGKLLLGELINEARRLHLRRLWHVTEPANVSMRSLGRSLGFVPADERNQFYLNVEELAEPVDEETRQRAYEIYLARGGAPGHDMEDWLQAERELLSKH